MFVVHNAWLSPQIGKPESGVKMKLVVDVFASGQLLCSHYSENIFYSPPHIPFGFVLPEESGPCAVLLDSNAIVSKDGICSLWRKINYRDEDYVSSNHIAYEELDLYEAQKCSGLSRLVSVPRGQPDFPTALEGQKTTHGQEVVVNIASWVDQTDCLLSDLVDRNRVHADEDFVVVYGNQGIAIGRI